MAKSDAAQDQGASLRDRALSPSATEPEVSAPAGVTIPSAIVTEHQGIVTLFSVRRGWEWGSIFVRPFDGGAEVVAHSSFGTFGYTWIAMGEDWRRFLASCSRDYAMSKMAGTAYQVPLGRAAFVEKMRAAVDEYEASIIEAWGLVDADQAKQISACREVLDDDWAWDDVPLDALFWHFNESAGGHPYSMELYDTRLTEVNSQVIGFWEMIWLPFAQAIEAGTVETERLDPKDESAVGEADASETQSEDQP